MGVRAIEQEKIRKPGHRYTQIGIGCLIPLLAQDLLLTTHNAYGRQELPRLEAGGKNNDLGGVPVTTAYGSTLVILLVLT